MELIRAHATRRTRPKDRATLRRRDSGSVPTKTRAAGATENTRSAVP